MNPDLQYAQAIKGVSKGCGIGMIDTVHLIEVRARPKFWSRPDCCAATIWQA